MANSLTFTSAGFSQNTAFALGATAETTILSSDASNTRRIYGIAFTNSASQTPTITIRIKDGSNVIGAAFITTAVTAINVMTDIFGSSTGAAIFQKQKDANGVPYYNLPETWTITAQLSANSTASAYIHVFGETYA
jgi:hypothetical protein